MTDIDTPPTPERVVHHEPHSFTVAPSASPRIIPTASELPDSERPEPLLYGVQYASDPAPLVSQSLIDFTRRLLQAR